MFDYQSLPPNTKLVEELIPRIRLQLDSETTPQYLNYIFDTIETLFADEFHMIADMDRSPVVKLWKMSANPNPFDLEDVTNIQKLIKQITLIQNSLRSRIGLQYKTKFYLIWRLYEEGKSWNEIYKITNKLEPYIMDRDNIIRNLKKYPKDFLWERKPNLTKTILKDDKQVKISIKKWEELIAKRIKF